MRMLSWERISGSQVSKGDYSVAKWFLYGELMTRLTSADSNSGTCQ